MFSESYLRYAHGIVSEYLEASVSEKFLAHLKLPPLEEVNARKRNSNSLDNEEVKKIKRECREKDALNAELARDAKGEKVSLYLTVLIFQSEKTISKTRTVRGMSTL